jgi:hypothetical protein
MRHGWISLDGIAFNLPSVPKTAGKLIGGCKAYNKSFGAPTVSSDIGIILVSGLVACPFRVA